MYHGQHFPYSGYFDTIDEIPDKAKVYFPDSTEPVEMSVEEMDRLSNEGWYAILHEVNYGVCDHWYSVPLSTWATKKFLSIIRCDNVDDNTVGYNREDWTVILTRDAHYRASEVWNS